MQPASSARSLSAFTSYVDQYAPGLTACFRGASPEAIGQIEHALGYPLPELQRQFLLLLGENRHNQLGSLLADRHFSLDWLAQAAGNIPASRAGWFPWLTEVGLDAEQDLYLAPLASDAPAHPAGSHRVVWCSADDAHGSHSHARNADLLEYLLLHAHCALRRATCETTAVLGIHPSDRRGQVRGRPRREIFVGIAAHLGFAPVPAADQWWLGYERPEAGLWCYVSPRGDDCEVALMAHEPRQFAELLHILLDNLDLYRIR